MLIRIGPETDTRVVQISGVARPSFGLRRRMNLLHPGGRDGRIGVDTVLADENEVHGLALLIDQGRAACGADMRALAKHVLLAGLPGTNQAARDLITKNAEKLVSEFCALLIQGFNTYDNSHDVAAFVLSKKDER